MKWFYNLLYSKMRAPWGLGCGTASNAIFLAHHGFTVTGTDYSPAAIALCQRRGGERERDVG